ncbi:uncharacterized protein LOC143275218 [Babylonia areolata]|uniref:uncharacterized protein LOC143275218 n=1 Tax=Babylonia areolata TaxID=304850 RepID=UPI003FD1F6C6
MSAFSVRSRGYQVGLLLLIISSILFIIGLVSPAWLEYYRVIYQIQEERLFAGVFIGCRYKLRLVGVTSIDFTRCSFGFAHAFDGMKDMGEWIHAVETFEILSAIALIFACIYGVTVNCFTIYPSARSRILEVTAGVAGLLAFIFTMVFVGQLRKTVEGNVFYTFQWAFYLTVVASISVMVAAVIIALFNEYIPPPADFNYSNAALSNSSNPIVGSSSFSAAPSTVFYSPSQRKGVGDDDDLYDSRVAKVISYEAEEAEEEEETGSRRGGGRRGGGRGPRSGSTAAGAGRYESDL